MIESREHAFKQSANERVTDMLAALDAVLLLLPHDPTDQMVAEVERIVTTLRTADEHVCHGNTAGALQALDLARGRIHRFVDYLAEPDGPDPDAPPEPGKPVSG